MKSRCKSQIALAEPRCTLHHLRPSQRGIQGTRPECRWIMGITELFSCKESSREIERNILQGYVMTQQGFKLKVDLDKMSERNSSL